MLDAGLGKVPADGAAIKPGRDDFHITSVQLLVVEWEQLLKSTFSNFLL
jgi:hypothetical protein